MHSNAPWTSLLKNECYMYMWFFVNLRFPFYKMKLFCSDPYVLECWKAGIFTTRKDDELVISSQIKFTTNLLLVKCIQKKTYRIHAPLHL